jgi:hypothetical protein
MDLLKTIIDLILCPWRFIFKPKQGEKKMELLQMLQDFMNKLGEAAGQIAQLQAKLQDAQAALEIQVKEAYDKGFADGVNSVQIPPSDKIYSQEDMDNAIKLAIEPLNAKIIELEGIVSGIDQKVNDAVALKLAEFKAKLDEVEAQF